MTAVVVPAVGSRHYAHRGPVFVVVLLALLSYRETAVSACVCLPRWTGPPCQAAWSVDAVFVGRVTEAQEVPKLYASQFKLQVLEKFRGVSTTEVTVMTSARGNCGVPFTVGTTFLVYASYQENTLWAESCSRTARLENAAVDLAYLRAMSRQPTGAGRGA